MFEESETINAKGEVHLEKIMSHVEKMEKDVQDILINMGKRCLKPQGETKCDRAFWFHKCWKTADPTVVSHITFLSLIIDYKFEI